MRFQINRVLALLTLVSLLLLFYPPQPVYSQVGDSLKNHRVIIDSSNKSALAEARSVGGKLLVDYGSFALYLIPDQTSLQASQANASSSALASVDDHLYLRNTTIQFGTDASGNSIQSLNSSSGGEGLWLVQFAGPIEPAWLMGLQSAGLEIVTYIPNNAYLVWGEHVAASLQDYTASQPLVLWTGPYHPEYRLAPGLQSAGIQGNTSGSGVSEVTIQVFNTPHLKDTLAKLADISGTIAPSTLPQLHLTDVQMVLPNTLLSTVTAWPDVINVEPFFPPQKQDEAQGQILAGSLVQSNGAFQPTGPGYLSWLSSKGFPSDPSAYPIVDVVDDGLDNGDVTNILHPDFYTLGNKTNPSRVTAIANCTADPSGNGIGGHGNLNAGIIAGFNDDQGTAYQDGLGYHYGLGISPFGRISSTKIFNNAGGYDLSHCGGVLNNIISNAYQAGARITSNSWGSGVSGAYDTEAQRYDLLTRDAVPTTAGNQEMLHIFAAGNSGGINSPGSAKNVITVGATENVRAQGVADGCLISSAGNADNIASYSQWGPTKDNRAKPDIVAPGTHVTGPASQDPNYTGGTICGMTTSTGHSGYYPNGQNLYTWSSGTSHSTPAISGVAQLVYNYYQRVLAPGLVPSPAMLKALIINTPRYLTGYHGSDTLPGDYQGWGDANLSQIFDGTPRILIDQTYLFSTTGATYDILGQVTDPSKPFRVSLVWTDAPGSPVSSNAAVNNLDLQVMIQQQTYLGNVFSGQYSIAGGKADTANNVENVFLPAGTSGDFHVRVTARNLTGDGVPGNDTPIDQDFALVIDNGIQISAPLLTIDKANIKWREIQGNQNGYIDPGETIGLTIPLINQGGESASQVQASLVGIEPALSVLKNNSTYPEITIGDTGTNQTEFAVKVSPIQSCTGSISLALNITANHFQDQILIPPLPIGSVTPAEMQATQLPVNIPDYDPKTQKVGEASIPLTIENHFQIDDLKVQVDITHTYDGDLNLLLYTPSGKVITLSSGNGGAGDNYHNTIFDDSASTSIRFGSPPFTGSYKPEDPLSAVMGNDAAGTWILKVQDIGTGDTGAVQAFSLKFRQVSCSVFYNNTTFWLPVIYR